MMSEDFKPGRAFNPGPPKKPVQVDRGGVEIGYNPTTVQEMITALQGGVSRRCAARHAGICVQTMEKWMVTHPEFAALVEETEANTELGLATTLMLKARAGDRSEERRVGKECRSRWSPY